MQLPRVMQLICLSYLQYDQLYPTTIPDSNKQPVENVDPSTSDQSESSEKKYNLGLLKQVQVIFSHLAYSKLQFYIPKGFWEHFRYAALDFLAAHMV